MKKQQLLCFTIFIMTTSFFQGMEENKLSADSIPTKSSLKIDAKVNVTDITTIFYIPDWKEYQGEAISPDELWYTNNDVNKMKAEYEEEKKQEEKKEQERKKREKSRQSMNKMFDAKK
ncbi:MAG: hypothetical protein ACXWL2_03655 [Candidatus Chromulinivorax sp.]